MNIGSALFALGPLDQLIFSKALDQLIFGKGCSEGGIKQFSKITTPLRGGLIMARDPSSRNLLGKGHLTFYIFGSVACLAGPEPKTLAALRLSLSSQRMRERLPQGPFLVVSFIPVHSQNKPQNKSPLRTSKMGVKMI